MEGFDAGSKKLIDVPFLTKLQQSGKTERIVRYEKRVKEGWSLKGIDKLIEAASLKMFLDNDVYGMFSESAHSSYLGIRQCLFTKDYKDQLSLCNFSKSLMLMLLARLCLEYPKVFSKLQEILNKQKDAYVMARQYAEMSKGKV